VPGVYYVLRSAAALRCLGSIVACVGDDLEWGFSWELQRFGELESLSISTRTVRY
jgi:hypothetical protein